MVDLVIKISHVESEIGSLRETVEKYNFYSKYRYSERFIERSDLSVYLNNFEDIDVNKVFYETDEKYYFVIGRILTRNGLPGKPGQELSIEDIVDYYEDLTTSFHKALKGNYIVVVINKRSREVTVQNSPLGVIAFYCYSDDNKIVLSSNLTIMSKILQRVQINEIGLIMYSMFDTLLGSNTLIKGVHALQYGEIVKISYGKIRSCIYYEHKDQFSSKPIHREDAIDALCTTLKNNMLSIPTKSPFLLGMTGGFDGRMNLALINKEDHKNIIGYTYGKRGSKEIEIAQLVARKFNLHHEVILLGADYEKDYIENSDETLMLGDGFAPFMRCNYLYSHRILSQFARNCITGMYGSEIIRPMHVMADDVALTTETVASFLSKNPLSSLEKLFKMYAVKGFLRPELFSNSNKDEILGLIEHCYLQNTHHLANEFRLYNFYLNEGMRKFFMEIIRLDRFFVEHSLPYLDLDFYETIMNTQYAGIYNNAFRESPISRRKGQFLYVDVMDRFASELNYIQVDRGYSPYRLKGGLNWITVALGFYFKKKLRKRIKGNDTFNTKFWRNMVYEENLGTLKKADAWFNDSLYSKFMEKYHLVSRNEHVFARHYSIKRWIELFQKEVELL